MVDTMRTLHGAYAPVSEPFGTGNFLHRLMRGDWRHGRQAIVRRLVGKEAAIDTAFLVAVRLIDNSPLGFVRGHEHHLSHAAVSLASSKPRSASGPTLAPMRTLINDQPTCSASCIATIGTGHMVA